MRSVAVERDQRVVIFGDITGVPVGAIDRFLTTAGHPQYGGSFPSCQNGQGAEVISQTLKVLREAGIAEPSPIIPCDSAEERMRQVLANPALLTREDRVGRPILVIDRDPLALAEGASHLPDNPQLSSLLSSTTIINVGPGEPFDTVDRRTNLRLVTLPLYCYPTHPTPDS